MNNISNPTVPQESLLELLRNNNPFSSNSAAEPWANRYPDVTTINRQAFEEICVLVRRKASEPTIPLAGLILGEAGQGKTHLMRRILLACKKQESPSLFVFVKPLVNPQRPFHLLLQEIVHCMSKTSEGEDDFSQFDRLVAEIIREYVRFRVTKDTKCATPNNQRFLEQFEADVFHIYDAEKVRSGVMEEIMSDKVTTLSVEIIEKHAVRYVHSQVSETSRQFLDVVFQYKTPEKQGLVRDWIKGSVLDEDACEVLGVSSRAEVSDEAKEHEAREMILTLGALFARYHLPMVICFDQLDNLLTMELIAGFANMIHLLVNDATSILPLAFIRADSWNERFQKSPDRAFVDRLESNKFSLLGCTIDEAEELVSRRIDQIFGEGTKEATTIEKWLLPELDLKIMGRELSPRQVILLANQIIRSASGDSKLIIQRVAESMAAEYKTAYEAVAVDYDAWDPESEYLQRAAELFLKNQEKVLSCEPGNDKYTTWTGTLKTPDAVPNGKEIPYACFINTAKHWHRVAATLDRCKMFLEKHPNGICTYITDSRCDFSPTWTATNEKRQEVESLGGNIVVLDQPAAVRWYGLVSLSWKIGSGDILLESERVLRPATDKDLENFLKTEFSTHVSEGQFDGLTKKKPPNDPIIDKIIITRQIVTTEELLRAVRECLSESTFPVLSIETLVVKLHEKGVKVTQEWCLQQLGSNQNFVSLFSTATSHMVKLVV